jgi:hypothetical protein
MKVRRRWPYLGLLGTVMLAILGQAFCRLCSQPRIDETAFQRTEPGMTLAAVEDVLGGPPGYHGDYACQQYSLCSVMTSISIEDALRWKTDSMEIWVWMDKQSGLANYTRILVCQAPPPPPKGFEKLRCRFGWSNLIQSASFFAGNWSAENHPITSRRRWAMVGLAGIGIAVSIGLGRHWPRQPDGDAEAVQRIEPGTTPSAADVGAPPSDDSSRPG